MYSLDFTKSYEASYRTMIKGNAIREKRVRKALGLLMNDPFYPSLKSHKVNTRKHGTKWSSRVTDDIRLIWDFDHDEAFLIDIIDIGTHSGRHAVYS